MTDGKILIDIVPSEAELQELIEIARDEVERIAHGNGARGQNATDRAFVGRLRMAVVEHAMRKQAAKVL